MISRAMKTVLITGGAGYLGSHLCGELLWQGYKVRVVDSLVYGGNSLLAYRTHPGFSFLKADIRDRRAIRPSFEGVEAVVHLAAVVGYPACTQAGPECSYEVNLEGTQNVFDLAEAAGALRFVLASTYSNYGISPDGLPVNEDSPLSPQSLYAETKIAAENFLMERAAASSCRPVVLRFSTVFGPSSRTRFDLIINQFVWQAVVEKKLLVYQKEYNRSFVHVSDISRAIQTALEAPAEKIRGRVFNVGRNDGNYTKAEIVALIAREVPDLSVEYRDLSFDGDMRDVRVSFDRIERELGWQAQVTIPEGVREMVDLVRSGMLKKI
jgi:nucleoside-diphosphate-sugar epimerase